MRVLMNRLRTRSLMERSQVHYGFMPDHGTRNAIFVLRRLVERSIQKQKDVFTCFIDYSKAFDTVKNVNFCWGYPLMSDYMDIKLLANLYWNQQKVRHNGKVRESMNSKAFDRVVSPRRICLHCTLKLP